MKGMFRVSKGKDDPAGTFNVLMTLEQLTAYLKRRAESPNNPETPDDGYEFYQAEQHGFAVGVEYIPLYDEESDA